MKKSAVASKLPSLASGTIRANTSCSAIALLGYWRRMFPWLFNIVDRPFYKTLPIGWRQTKRHHTNNSSYTAKLGNYGHSNNEFVAIMNKNLYFSLVPNKYFPTKNGYNDVTEFDITKVWLYSSDSKPGCRDIMTGLPPIITIPWSLHSFYDLRVPSNICIT